jgi:hypothetical protein
MRTTVALRMLLVKHWTFSAYASFHCIATSTVVPSFAN